MYQANISYFVERASELDTTTKNLYLYIGTNTLAYTIVNEEATIVAFEKYNLPNTDNVYTLFFESKKWLTNTFKNIKITFGAVQTSAIPTTYFAASNIPNILTLQYGDVDTYKCFYNTIANHKLHIAYRVPYSNAKQIITQYPAASMYHCQAVVLANTSTQPNLQLLFLDDVLTLTLTNETTLLSTKTIPVLSNEDVLYQVLLLLQIHQINEATIPIVISGWITEKSALYQELYKYCTNLQFETSLAHLHINSKELEPHFFTLFEQMHTQP